MFKRLSLDYLSLLNLFALSLFSLLALYSISFSSEGATNYFAKQALWIFIGFVIYFAFQFISSRVLYNYAYLAYFAIILLLILVLLFAPEAKGSKRWFLMGPLKLQPSELAKFISIITIARFVSNHDTNLTHAKDILLAASILFLPFVLINLQPDLGTSLTFLAISIPVLFWAGMPGFYVFALVSAILVLIFAYDTFLYLVAMSVCVLFIYFFKASPYLKIALMLIYIAGGWAAPKIWNDVLKPHQRSRILSLLNPNDIKGSGYQVYQAKIAIGSGGELGKGLGKGTQVQLGLVPEVHTDFIISIIAEEFGFWAVAILLGLFAFLIIRLIYYAFQVKSQFSSVILIAVATMFLYQIFTNMGMAIAYMPVTGLPLPFISYGGSAMMTNMLLMGLCSNIIRHRYE